MPRGAQLGRETRGPCVIARSGRAKEDLGDHVESLPFPHVVAAPVIEHAVAPRDMDVVRTLFVEYAESLGADFYPQGFESELAELPGDYAQPDGCLLIVRAGDALVACVALRRLDELTCEMKRFYVRPSERGVGLGRALADGVIAESRRLGYARMRLDTLPTMAVAFALYERLGFREIEPYYENPIPGIRYLELEL